MSIIEQAAKRLEQLRKSGVEVESEAATKPAADESPERLADAVPLRVVKELESRTGETAQPRLEDTVPVRPGRDPVPVLAASGRAEIDLAMLAANGYITPNAPRSRLAEEFRVVKRPLMNNIGGKSGPAVTNANRIMVASALPGEGKTFVSLNLAMSLAMEIDIEVLLVDADVSRPSIQERLGLAPSKGLLDLLVDPGLTVESVVQRTNVDHLSILPAGSSQMHATELLSSATMSRLVERLATDDPRRVVVFDTPPLLSASESRVLGAHMGQIIMVIAADDTTQGTVAEGLATLENCPVVFTLLNRVSHSERGHYYGSYGAYAR